MIDQDPFSDLDIPPVLEESLRGHRAHLAELRRHMQTAGIGANQIEESISTIVSSYKEELIRSIKSMAR